MWAAYAATKEAIRGLSKVAAHEWARYGITVNVVCPFAASTGYQMAADANPEMAERWVRANPMRRIGDPEHDIGRVVVFLAGPDSGYVTGQTIHVDGGQVHVP
jgi:NAD(P)-dependent dehydrogenase (short-subunit alcohol dehydrogenase family)